MAVSTVAAAPSALVVHSTRTVWPRNAATRASFRALRPVQVVRFRPLNPRRDLSSPRSRDKNVALASLYPLSPRDVFSTGFVPPLTDLATSLLDDITGATSGLRMPCGMAVDVVEKPEAFEIIGEVPGLSEDDIKLSLEDKVLTLSSHKELETNKEYGDGRVLRMERSARKFSRSFRLPKDVDQDAITAELEQGLLKVTLPRVPSNKPSAKTICIQKGSAATSDVPVQTPSTEAS